MTRPQPPRPTHRAFDDIERLAAQVDSIYDTQVRLPGAPRLDIAASFDDLMAASWAFFEQEQAKHDALTFALQAKVEEYLAQRPVEAPAQAYRQSQSAASANVIDVDAREVRESNEVLPSGGGGPEHAT